VNNFLRIRSRTNIGGFQSLGGLEHNTSDLWNFDDGNDTSNHADTTEKMDSDSDGSSPLSIDTTSNIASSRTSTFTPLLLDFSTPSEVTRNWATTLITKVPEYFDQETNDIITMSDPIKPRQIAAIKRKTFGPLVYLNYTIEGAADESGIVASSAIIIFKIKHPEYEGVSYLF